MKDCLMRWEGDLVACQSSRSQQIPIVTRLAVILLTMPGLMMAQMSANAESASSLSGSGEWDTHEDTQQRFRFSYPVAFGSISQGTNRGIQSTGDQGEAFRFAAFSSGTRGGRLVLEGEAVLTTGRPWVTVALGGLHDPILLGGIVDALPTAVQTDLLTHASLVGPSNFCQELSAPHHLDEDAPAFTAMTSAHHTALRELDRMRNIDPQVVYCEAVGDTVTFEKEATFESGSFRGRQHIYGAIRFLGGPFSSFQLIQIANDAPTDALLQEMAAVVKSFTQ